MSSISAEPPGFFDFQAYALPAEALRSLPALQAPWRDHLLRQAETVPADPDFRHFLVLTAELPVSIGDVGWQQQWMRAWYRLHGRDCSPARLQQLLHAASAHCETFLLEDTANAVPRLHYELIGMLNRAVLAAIGCAIELSEEARREERGPPGELAALACLRRLLADARPAAVLSVALLDREACSVLTASDRQRLPSLLADHLARLLHDGDSVFIGREGEWLVVLPEVLGMAQAGLAAARIGRAFAEPVRLFGGRSLLLQATVGAAMLPEHGEDAESALQAARLARWSLVGSDQAFDWYARSMSHDWQHRIALAEELQAALNGDALQLFLQPQVDLVSLQCTGAELLLRWQRRDGSCVAPPEIVALIEENGWRPLFTDWLVRGALQMASELDRADIGVSLSFNLTAADLVDRELPELLAQRCATWEVPAARFTLELTESALMGDRHAGLAVMQRLRAQGFRIALDDFGTGYSSLSYLVGLPINEIKIDRAFIVAMLDTEEGLRIVRTIVDLARDLDLRPLAEGVESEAQRNCLIGLGCHLAQGFLYAQPMPLGEFVAWYRQRNA